MSPYTLVTGGYAQRSVSVLSFDPTKADPNERLVVTRELTHGHAPTWLTFSEDGTSSFLALPRRARS